MHRERTRPTQAPNELRNAARSASTFPRAAFRAALRAALLVLGVATATTAEEVRALWVTRYDFRTADDVRTIVRQAASVGVNRLLWQVRGQADALYLSALEPRSALLAGAEPDFDPLAVAVHEARERGLAIEAWVNALPLWKGARPPTDPAHPFLRHPEWLLVGSDGEPQRLNAHYVCANPALEPVRAHVAAVCADLARRYEIDAVHLDYIRYVTDLEGGRDFSYDPVSLERFGHDPKADPAGWAAFKRDQVTGLVRAVRAAVTSARPGCRVTAAVFPGDAARARVFQDVRAWVREGLVDALYPMNYASEPSTFDARLAEDKTLASIEGAPRRVAVHAGLGVFRLQARDELARQIAGARAAGTGGVALFCYSALFESADRTELFTPQDDLRALRREAIRAAFGLPASLTPPAPPE